MKIWMSAEVDDKASDAFRKSATALEHEINEKLAPLGLIKGGSLWSFVAIIMKENDPIYREIHRQNKRKAEYEFRLKIDYFDFISSSIRGQREMIVAALRRSVALMGTLGVPDSDRVRLNALLDEL